MEVPVSDAKAQLTELVRRAQTGEDVILTRHGQPTVRLVPVVSRPDAQVRRGQIERLRTAAIGKARAPGLVSDDEFLYGPDGLPR